MRLADTPVPARAGGDADSAAAGRKPAAGAGSVSARAVSKAGAVSDGRVTDGAVLDDAVLDGTGSDGAVLNGTVFDEAAAAFEAGRDSIAEVRDDIDVEDWPAPKRLAPHALALAATAYRDGAEAGTGRLVLLFDPAGRDGWTGTFRLVAQVHADVEEEMAADPLLGEVGWSWLTDALDLHAPGYQAPSGTVTRVITEGYGGKADEPPSTAFELRASWCPGDDETGDEICGAVLAWCDLLAAAAGLPPQPPGTRALGRRGAGTRGRRRR
jgi:Protein of unknown function (DUF3000)